MASGARGVMVPRYLSKHVSSSARSKSPTMSTSRFPEWNRPSTIFCMPCSVSASISACVGSRKRRSSFPNIALRMRSAVLRSRLFWTDRPLERKACFARSMAASSQRGCSSSRCTSSKGRHRPCSPEPTAKCTSKTMFSSSASSWQSMRLVMQKASTSSRGQSPTDPTSDSARAPMTTAPKPSGPVSIFSHARPPLAITRSSAALGSLSVRR
mmetsp:Transcript_40733/g.121500  ORF Transcript_40733/g.121500 Transcript_40733/m.121500 type:complete len:212 (+) Transcript_40733:1864-2499(+)